MSLYNMKPKYIITSSNFVKEPVDIVIGQINQSVNKKIILTGPRGSGKTIVLNALEQERLNTGHDAIYMFVDPTTNASYLTDEEQYYQCELFFCFELYQYINKRYPTIYQEKFIQAHQELKETKKDFIRSINNGFDSFHKKHPTFNKPGTLIKEIIDKMKQEIGMDTITICLDRFDWVGQSNKRIQEIMRFYFELFDKAIITTDDREVYYNIDYKCKYLEAKNYQILPVDYGKDESITKDIVTADLAYYEQARYNSKNPFYSQIHDKQFPDIRNLLSSEVYDILIRQCSGDFKLLFNILHYVYCDDTNRDVEEKIKDYYNYFFEKKVTAARNHVRKLHL